MKTRRNPHSQSLRLSANRRVRSQAAFSSTAALALLLTLSLRAEFERLVPLMRTGGFIPSADHRTPRGVSLEQYRCYLRLLEEYTAL